MSLRSSSHRASITVGNVGEAPSSAPGPEKWYGEEDPQQGQNSHLGPQKPKPGESWGQGQTETLEGLSDRKSRRQGEKQREGRPEGGQGGLVGGQGAPGLQRSLLWGSGSQRK